MDAALQGSLDSFKLPDILTFLNTTRKTGTLTLRSGAKEAHVYFGDGLVVFAASNQEQLRLGSILLRSKKISRDQLDELTQEVMREGEKLGQVAIRMKMLTDEELRDYLKIQVSEIIFDSFVWGGGRFSFLDVMNLPDYAVTIALDLPNLIMEGARRIDEWEGLLQHLPSPTTVFRVVGNPQTEDKITLTRDEWKILFLVNGKRTLEQLCHDSDESALQVYRVVYGLYANKLIEPASAAATAEETDKAVSLPAERGESSVTMKQGGTIQLTTASEDATVHVLPPEDDRNLLVSPEAHLSYRDVVKTVVARLSLRNGEGEPTSYSLTEQEYRIGRLRENQIQLFDLSISGAHARIYRGPEGYILEDLKSRNGTFVNNTRVYSRLLHDGDIVRLGSMELVYTVL